jgi:hypothetical protein
MVLTVLQEKSALQVWWWLLAVWLVAAIVAASTPAAACEAGRGSPDVSRA